MGHACILIKPGISLFTHKFNYIGCLNKRAMPAMEKMNYFLITMALLLAHTLVMGPFYIMQHSFQESPSLKIRFKAIVYISRSKE